MGSTVAVCAHAKPGGSGSSSGNKNAIPPENVRNSEPLEAYSPRKYHKLSLDTKHWKKGELSFFVSLVFLVQGTRTHALFLDVLARELED